MRKLVRTKGGPTAAAAAPQIGINFSRREGASPEHLRLYRRKDRHPSRPPTKDFSKETHDARAQHTERRLKRESSLKPKRVEPERGSGGGTGGVSEREGVGERGGGSKESERWIY